MILDYMYFFQTLVNHHERRELNICRVYSMLSQDGLCFITGQQLKEKERELHHRTPKFYGGEDELDNLIYLINKTVHRMIHENDAEKFTEYIAALSLTQKQLRFINQLRIEANRRPFCFVTRT